MTDLLAGAADIVLQQLGVDSDDRFLVVSNPELDGVAAALATAARAHDRDVCLCEVRRDEPRRRRAAGLRRSGDV